MDAEHRRRIANNERTFEQVNYTVGAVGTAGGEGLDADGYGPASYDCECAGTCGAIMRLTPLEYEHARSNLAWFAYGPAHRVSAAEEVVESHASHWIIARSPT
ncbi:MAG: hypothetical protein JWM98_3317 [Thermoleophilia bacterium]|nr:hypothetical protein [Thermoleophilia bacterium]